MTLAEATGFPGGISFNENKLPMQNPGLCSIQVLDAATDVVSDQTVTIGADVYRVADVDTDSGEDTANGELNNTDGESFITMAAHGLIVGDLILVQTELMRVLTVISPSRLRVKRGVCGTTIATHADALDILQELAPGDGNIAVGLQGTLTATLFHTAFVACINDGDGVEHVGATKFDASTVIIFSAGKPGGSPAASIAALATTETLAGSGNAWQAATMNAGHGPRNVVIETIVPTAIQVTEGSIFRYYPFAPLEVDVIVRVTATNAAVAWIGVVTIVGNRIEIDNGGAVDWAVTDTLKIIVSG